MEDWVIDLLGVCCILSAFFITTLRLYEKKKHSNRVFAPQAVYSTLSSLKNREIETETLIFAPISLSYIEID